MARVPIEFPEDEGIEVSGNPEIMMLGNPKRRKKRRKAAKRRKSSTSSVSAKRRKAGKKGARTRKANKLKRSLAAKKSSRKRSRKPGVTKVRRRRRKIATHAVSVRPRKKKGFKRPRKRGRKVARTGPIQSVTVHTSAPKTRRGRAKTIRINKRRNPKNILTGLMDFGKDAGWVLLGLAGSKALTRFIPRIPVVGPAISRLPFSDVIESAIPPVILIAGKKFIPLKGNAYNLLVTGSVANTLFKALGKVPVLNQYLGGFEEDSLLVLDNDFDDLSALPLDAGDYADILEDALSQEDMEDFEDEEEDVGDVFNVEEDMGDVFEVEEGSGVGDVFEVGEE